MIGVSVSTLRNWEQGRRRREGAARALMQVAVANPEGRQRRWGGKELKR